MPRPAKTVTAEEAQQLLQWTDAVHRPTRVRIGRARVSLHIPTEGDARSLCPRAGKDVIVVDPKSGEWFQLTEEEATRLYKETSP